MTNETTKLVLKASGIFLLAKAVLFIPEIASLIPVYSYIENDKLSVITISIIITFLILVVSGILLIVKNKPEAKIEAPSENLLPLAIIIGAVIIFFQSLSELPTVIGMLVYGTTDQYSYSYINFYGTALKLIGNLIGLCIGAIMFFKAKTIARWIK